MTQEEPIDCLQFDFSVAKMPSLLDKVKFLCVAGVGLFSDGYLNLTIGLGLWILETNISLFEANCIICSGTNVGLPVLAGPRW